jgi:hypothetical protein
MFRRLFSMMALVVLSATMYSLFHFVVWFADGQLVVLAPADQPLIVEVDGEVVANVPPARHERIMLPQGSHQVQLTVGGRQLAPQSLDIPETDLPTA